MSVGGFPVEREATPAVDVSGLLALDREARRDLLVGAAAASLAPWGLWKARVVLLEQKTHITFRVDASAADDAPPQRFLLRVCQLGAYERAQVISEAVWLLALREAGLVVPEPVPALDGSLVCSAFLPEWGGARWCLLYRWVPGEIVEAEVTPEIIEQVGQLAGRIHACSEQFVPPPDFSRPRWDCDRLFGRETVIPAGRGEPLITPRIREILDAAAREVRQEVERLGEGRTVFGLIHKDLEPDNTVLDGGRVHAIDFADCGWGWYLYDIAASLLPLREKKGYPELRVAFLRGYRRVRPLSAEHEALIDTFLIARSLFTIRFMVLTSLEQRPELEGYANVVIPLMIGEIRRYLDRRQSGRLAAEPTSGRTTVVQFLARLRDRGIKLWSEGEKLRFKAPQGALKPELRGELGERKAEILAFLRQGQAAVRISGPVRRGAPEAGPVPLSFAQQRLWFLDQLHPGSSEYNIARAVSLRGELRVAVLERSFQEVIRRHAVLRTTFAMAEGEPVQIVARSLHLSLPVIDLRSLPEGEKLAEAQRLIDQEGRRPFDLARGPLVRVFLLHLADDDHLAASTMHHIISDGWSTGLLFREMGLLYHTFVSGRPTPLPELPLQYTDFSWWQREVLQGDLLQGQLDWWMEQFAGAPERLELPTDRPRSALGESRGGRVDTALPARLAAQLREAGQAGGGATLFMVLFAAWNALLARVSGQDDIVLGIPIANRNRTEIEPLIGFFVNTLALRTRLSGDPTWRELLGRVREVTLGAYARQDLPFERLVAELRPDRALAVNPLFSVMFALQNAQREEPLSLPGLIMSGSPLGLSGGPAKFDLTLSLVDGDESVKGSLEYRTELFDRPTIVRLLARWRVLLEGVAEAPALRLSELPAMVEAERHQVLLAWSDTAGPDPARCLHELFAERALERPAAVAVSAPDGELTYGELRQRAGRLGAALRGLGIGPDAAVGVCLERSAQAVTVLLAVLEAGGAFVPLDPSYPAERLGHMAADAGVRLLLIAERLRGRLPDLPGVERIATVEDLERRDAAGASERNATATLPDHLAYVMFTSGSTGRPKGVAVPHRAVARLVLGANYARLGPEEVILQYAPLSFDASTLEIWGCLLHGGRLVIPAEGAVSLEELGATLAAGGVTTLWLTAGLFHQVAEAHPEGLRTVRQLLAGGDVLSPEHVRRVLARWPGLHLVNGYGPTENTTFTCCHRMTAAAEIESPVPIGRPITGTRVALLDRWLAPAPIGVVGELHAAGHGLARGYAGRPDLTAERFVPHPCPCVPGERLYRTGDLARWRPDGTLEFLGRRDHQVKVRGFRIELGEIESALEGIPGIRQAVVLALEEVPWDKRLVACLVVAGDPPDPGRLREALRTTLPEFMIPFAFVPVDSLPLGPTGKVDRRALARLDLVSETASAESESPRDPVEEILAGIFREVLRAGRVGRDSEFFALGGHSLLATQVISRVREAFGVDLPLRRLFEDPTVAGLAEAVRRELRRAAGTEAPPIVPVPRNRPLPLSFAQQRLWFLDRLQPGDSAYNVPAAVRLSGSLAADLLERAAREVVQRHEALRTTFAEVPGGPVQVISAEPRLELPRVDLGALAPDFREAEARRLAAAEALRPFDLAAGPLLRMTLLRLDTHEHVALVTFHHIVADGWSLGVFLGELGSLYQAFSRGVGSPLRALPVQYADFAVWQRARLDGGALAEQLDWWRQRLDGAPEIVELPTDRPRSAVATSRRGELILDLGDLAGRLREGARGAGSSLFMVLLAAWNALLARLSGQDDLVLGIPIANRNHREIEGLIGFFVNSLALRTDLSGDPVWGELLGRVRDVALEAYSRQDLPFETLVAELRPDRSLAGNPLFQLMFAFRSEQEEPGIALPGLSMSPISTAEEGTAKLDLTLSLLEAAGGLRASLEYRAELFEAATVRRLLERWRAVLVSIVEMPDLRLSALPLLSDVERHQLLVAWNDTEGPDPARCVHEIFADRVRERPDAPAISAADANLTYGELSQRASRLAAALRGLGVGPDQAVGVCLERSARAVTALLAVLEAGGAFVPLDPSLPAERLGHMVADAGLRLAVTSEALRERLPALPGMERIVLFEELETDGTAPLPLPSPVAPDHLAYIMFTSGSTGRPKGVAVSHRAVTRLVLGSDFAQLGPDEVFLQYAPLSFDASTLEIWGCLLSGGRLVVPPEGRLSLEELGGVIAAGGVTTLWLTAGLFHQMIERFSEGVRPVRQLLAGGDVLSPEHVRRALAQSPGLLLINGYGPTENTTFTCCHRMSVPDRVPAPVPVGRPVSGTRVFLLDRWLAPVPAGVVGELYAAGHGLARGYAGRPDLTAERFVPHPCPSVPGERLYHTGDLARWRSDGSLDFLGRRDHQVKVRGFRIELGEIEAALARLPAVREAAVLVREEGAGSKRLVACAAGDGLDAVNLRQALRAVLPDYMVPSEFVFVDSLPLAPTGKVDRRALAALGPSGEPVAPRGRTAPPGDAVEELLASLWAEVLGRERVDREDDFFVLGGHSLLATQLVSRVRETFGIEIPLRRLFDAPTVAGLASAVRDALRRGQRSDVPPIVPVSRERDLPLSFAQQRLWFLDRLQPAGSAYNVPAALRLYGALDPATLRAVFSEVVRRHEVLRTVFSEGPDGPVQVIRAFPTGKVTEIPLVDLSGLPQMEREGAARHIAAAEAARPFDLTAGPLLRVSLFRLGMEEHLLLVTFHHIVADGWSTGVLFGEVGALFEAFSRGAASPLAPLRVQYADFAVWQRSWLTGEVLEEEIRHWRERLAGAPHALFLPLDRPRPAVQSLRGGVRERVLGPELRDAVAALAHRLGATPFMILLCAFQGFLGRVSGQEDLLVGAPIAGRNRREIEDLIGFFVNTLALRADLTGSPGFADLVARVRATALDAFAHQDLPLERLVDELHCERDLSRHPLFQVAFAMQNAPLPELRMTGLTLAALPLPARTAKFDLTLAVSTEEERLVASLEHDADLFDGTTADRLLDGFVALLSAALYDPERPWPSLTLLRPVELHQVLVEWNDTPEPYGLADLCVPQRIAGWAARAPSAPAVVQANHVLTYCELDQQANRLAQFLLSLGVGPETIVAVCLERSPREIVTLLAVLIAGAAYLPLDPTHPPERLDSLLVDSGASVLVTDGGRLSGTRATHVDLDRDAEAIAARSCAPPRGGAQPVHLAYVIYTSGSTGRPKGVLVEHRGLLRLIAWHLRAFGVAPGDRATRLAGLGFDAAVWELWPYLVAGASIHLPTEEVRTVPAALRDWLLASEITHTFAPTPLAEALLALSWPDRTPLRLLLTGGDRLHHRPPPDLPFRLVNNYGPTECTVVATSGEIPADGEVERAPDIGRPIDGVRVLVADRHLRPVPIGVAGELCAGGGQVARGYLAKPNLTAERFVPDPFGAPGGRVYRTGDLVRRLADGRIDFLGRLDEQVKVRGIRIEPGEIEAVLASFPGVRECAVVAVGDPVGGARLVAFIVTAGALGTEKLRVYLRKILPDAMVPSAFVPLATLPVTPNGKVDRDALERAAPAPAGDATPPRDAIEFQLVRIWEELLGVQPIGVRDDFFELGGHSLLAARLMGRVRDRFGCAIPLAALFQGATVESLADLVRRAAGSVRRQALVPIHPGGPRPPLFLVHPVGGNVLCYAELARRIGPEQPLFGLQVPDGEDGCPATSTLQEMAVTYLEAARSAHPGGPWLLGGWSMGGVVAFEMARLLTAGGESVELLAIIDAVAPGLAASARGIRKADPADLFVRDLAGTWGIEIPHAEPGSPPDPGEVLGRVARSGAAADLGEAELLSMLKRFQGNLEALDHYTPGSYPGRVVVLRTEESAALVEDPTLGWRDLAQGGLGLIELPGSHYSLLRAPHVEELARRLGELLDGAH